MAYRDAHIHGSVRGDKQVNSACNGKGDGNTMCRAEGCRRVSVCQPEGSTPGGQGVPSAGEPVGDVGGLGRGTAEDRVAVHSSQRITGTAVIPSHCSNLRRYRSHALARLFCRAAPRRHTKLSKLLLFGKRSV